MTRFLCLFLFCIPVAAQTIAPSQIKPGAENQVLTTIGGKGTWGTPTPSGVGTFNGRSGAVLPLTGDYACSMITGALCTLPSLYNQTINVSGTPYIQEPNLNFIPSTSGGPSGIACADNPSTHSTDCTFSLGGSGGAPVCGLHGCYAVLATGTLIQWGTIAGCGGGIHACNVPVFFPTAFSSTSGLAVSITEQGGGTNNYNTTASSPTPSGFNAQFASLIYTGGSGVDLNGTETATWIAIGPGTGTGGPSAGGVNSINGVSGDFTFSGSGVSCSGTTCTFSSGGFTAAGDLSGSSSSQTVTGLKGVPFCSGFAPTNGQFIELTTGSSPNPCYTATTPSGSGNTTSTSLTTNRLPKANGANSIIDSSVSDNGTTVSTTEPLTAPAVNTVINAGNSLSAAVTACGSAQTTIQITQTIAVGSGITVPANCALLFQSAGNLTGTSITINGPVQATPAQIFGSGLAVTGLRGAVSAEWFGVAQPYASVSTAAAGAADDANAAAAIASITRGGWVQFRCGYYHVNTLAFTTSNTGAKGLCHGYSYPSASQATVIVSSSATAPQVTFGNGSGGAQIVWNVLEDIALQRSVHPTGSTSAGLSIDNAGGLYAHNVKVEDSLPLVYAHMAPSYGFGLYRLSADWGESVVAGSAYAADAPKGFYIDSADGNEENSLNIVDSEVNCAPLDGTGAVTTGYLITGAAISDVNVESSATAGCNHASRITYTGSTSGVASNIRFDNFVADGSVTDSVLIENVRPGAHGTGGNITFNGGVIAGGASCNVDIENSMGVNFGNVLIDSGVRSCVNNSSDISFVGDQFNIIGFPNTKGIVFTGTVNSHVTSTFGNTSTATGNVDIEFDSSSTNNVVDGSTFSLSATNAIKCDGTSGNNAVGINAYDPLVTTPVTGCNATYQVPVALTTTGTSGTATFNPATGALNIPNYSTGGGSITFPQTVAGTVNSGGLVYANSGTQISVSPAGTAGQVVLWGGAGTAPGAQAIGTSGATIPLLNGANNSSGNNTFSAAGAASTPGVTFTGAPFTGGTGTTTFPYVYINNGATAPTTLNTAGTEFGINAPSGFTGSLMDVHVNGGGSLFTLSNGGVLTVSSQMVAHNLSINSGIAQISSLGQMLGTAFESTGTKFTTSGCSVSSTTGGGTAGIFTLGANSCTVIVTMSGATGNTANNGWSCQAHDRTAPTVLIGGESSSTTTTASITIPAGAGTTDVISFACIAF